jgi:uncharacterized protein (DUF488 family)
MTRRGPKSPTQVLTIGHSTRPIETFIEILQAQGVKRVVDVRTVPRSRHNPQYNRDVLPQSLAGAGIKYEHMSGLGGLRHARRDSINTGWRNEGFRGFADYMLTREFQASLEQLIQLARDEITAIMCAEAVPWRCHRSLISDALLVRGIKVEHITSKKSRHEHSLTAWVQVEASRITYPSETLELDFKAKKQAP